jgi:hypothetical protein
MGLQTRMFLLIAVMFYEGYLEADYIQYLAKVQKAAKENPVDVEFDFP